MKTRKTKFPLDDLPDDIKFHVFSFLNRPELGRISEVSKNFNKIANHPSLVNHAPVRPVDYSNFISSKSYTLPAIRCMREVPPYLFAVVHQQTNHLITLYDGKHLNKKVGELSGHTGAISHLLAASNKKLLSLGADRTLRIWDMTNYSQLFAFQFTFTYELHVKPTKIVMIHDDVAAVILDIKQLHSVIVLFDINHMKQLDQLIIEGKEVQFLATKNEQELIVGFNIRIPLLLETEMVPGIVGYAIGTLNLKDKKISINRSVDNPAIDAFLMPNNKYTAVTITSVLIITDLNNNEDDQQFRLPGFEEENVPEVDQVIVSMIKAVLYLGGPNIALHYPGHINIFNADKGEIIFDLDITHNSRMLKLSDHSIALYDTENGQSEFQILKFAPLQPTLAREEINGPSNEVDEGPRHRCRMM